MSRSSKRGVATGAGIDPKTGKRAGANGEDAIEADGSYQTLSLNSSSTTESASVEDEVKGNGPSNVSQLPQPRPLIVRNTPKSTGITIPPAIISEVGLFLQPKERVELIKVHPSIEAVRSSNAMSVLESLFPEQYARLNANQMPSAETAEAVVKLWARFKDLNRALLFAAKKEREAVMLVLIELGADLSMKDDWGKTALHYAAERGYVDVVRVIVELGADISVRDVNKRAALWYASSGGHVDVVRALFKVHRPNVYLPSSDRIKALFCAACVGHVEMVRVLHHFGTNTNAVDSLWRTAVHFAAKRGCVDVVRVLVELGADVSARDRLKKTALHYAAERGYVDVVRVLVELGADVSARDRLKKTALHYAAERGDAYVVRVLVELGADIFSAGGVPGKTALLYAVEHRHAEVVRALINSGAYVSEIGVDGRSVLDVAREVGNEEVVLRTQTALALDESEQSALGCRM